MKKDIIGYGGGKDAPATAGRTPVESPDSLHSTSYAKLLDLVSEGEIEGLVDGMESIFLDETPLQNEDGSYNFSGVQVDFRPGTQTQDYIAGFPAVESESSVNIEFTSDAPWSRAVNDTQLSAVRVRLAVNGLSQQNTENGDINGYTVAYVIEVATDGGPYVQAVNTAFSGKTTSRYERSHRVNLPPATVGWTVRVRRLTGNSSTASIVDKTYVAAITEIIDAKLRYPMSAIVGIQIDASQFSGIPTRGYHLRGRIIKVPTNYTPASRTYVGTWDGTFKLAYSNNPAWVYYDILLNDRYGLGSRVNASQIDRYRLYEIARYCDVMVSDGKGGQEPRFTCNCYLQSRADAFRVLQDLASIFRGMSYWGGGQVIVTADKPADPAYTYTAANVLDGKFVTSGNPLSSRYSVALVSWNDPDNFYKQKVEAVQDEVSIRRYGLQQIELTAFGCTSQGQAQRVGMWATSTSRLETGTITFKVGMDGTVCMPGQIIRVADPTRMGRRNAGRISGATTNTVTVDKVQVAAVGDQVTVILPNATPETKTIQSVSGNTFTMTSSWSDVPTAESVWSIDNVDLAAPLYKVISVSEVEDLVFEVTALQHEPGKYAFIDNGTRIDAAPTTVVPPSVQAQPPSVTITSNTIEDQGIVSTTMTISWEAAPSAIAYIPEWKKDDGNWILLPRTNQLSAEVPNIYKGNYLARVRAFNSLEVQSIPKLSAQVALEGKTTPPPIVTSLTTFPLLFGIEVEWGFPATGATDTERTEIWYGPTNDLSMATKLGDFAYPQKKYQIMGLAAGQTFFFWARLVDRSGNVGAFYPTGAGVIGIASTDASDILDAITGQITESQLSSSLLAKLDGDIDLDDVTDFLGSAQIQAMVAADKAIVQQTQVSAAALLNEKTVRATETGALASQVDTAIAASAAGVAQATTALETVSNLNGEVSAMYTIKTQVTADGRTVLAGIGVGVDNSTGILESQVLITADKFAILQEVSGSSEIVSPFLISGGQVFINKAVIGDATIEFAKIDTATITNLSALNSNMGTITAGKLQSADGKFLIDLDNKTISITT